MKPDEVESLKFVRIFDPVHIPKEYIEQIKGREFDVEKFYAYQKEVCTSISGEYLALNPHNLLYAITTDKNVVKGVLWMVIDVLGNSLVINTFSIDKELWGKGRAIQLIKEKALEIKNGAKLDRIYWITRCPKHSERYGFKRSKNVLMEFEDGQHSKGGISGGSSRDCSQEGVGSTRINDQGHVIGKRTTTGGNSQVDDSRTEAIS